jgi:hypothetical protein
LSDAEVPLDVVGKVDLPRRASLKTGTRMSLRNIGTALAERALGARTKPLALSNVGTTQGGNQQVSFLALFFRAFSGRGTSNRDRLDVQLAIRPDAHVLLRPS